MDVRRLHKSGEGTKKQKGVCVVVGGVNRWDPKGSQSRGEGDRELNGGQSRGEESESKGGSEKG